MEEWDNLRGAKAVRDAKEKAAVLSQAAGVTLKGIQTIDYSWGEVDFKVRATERMSLPESAACDSSAFDMDIEPDDIETSDTVTVVWEIA